MALAQATARVVTVDTAEKLFAALEAATTGTVIELAPGDYGELAIGVDYRHPWGAYDGTVTVRSADADNPATFTNMRLNGVTNLEFEDIVVDFEAPTEGNIEGIKRAPGVRLENAENVTFHNVQFIGDMLDRPEDIHDGLPVGYGLTVRDSSGITVTDSTFVDWLRAATFGNSTDLVITGNEITGIRSDGFNFAQVQRVLIEGNHFHDFTSIESSPDHRDMIQFWTAGAEIPSTDIVIRNNILDAGDGIGTQSIFMRNEIVDSYGAGPELFYQRVLIEGNVIHNAHLHGITLGATTDLTIINNTLLHNRDAGDNGNSSEPRINLAPASENVLVTKNIAHGITEAPDGVAGWNVSDNLVVQNDFDTRGNYVGDLFINALAGSESDLAGLQVLPGSAADLGGYGAPLTRYSTAPEALTAVIRPEPGKEPEMFSFDAGLTADAGGRVTADEAKFVWDLGDGNTKSGPVIQHAYAQPGTYIVTLTVTHQDGSQDRTQTKTYVPEPLRLALDVTAKGLVNLSPYAEEGPAGELPEVKVVYDGERTGALLEADTGIVLSRGVTAPVYDLDDFFFSLDLKATAGAASAGGIFRIHTSMLLSVSEDGALKFEFINADGQTSTVQTQSSGLLNGDWHRVEVAYDQDAGLLSVILDGTTLGTALATGSSKEREAWGLTIGATNTKKGFVGLVDNFVVGSVPTRDTLDLPTDVALYETRGSIPATTLTVTTTSDFDNLVLSDDAEVVRLHSGDVRDLIRNFDPATDQLDLSSLGITGFDQLQITEVLRKDGSVSWISVAGSDGDAMVFLRFSDGVTLAADTLQAQHFVYASQNVPSDTFVYRKGDGVVTIGEDGTATAPDAINRVVFEDIRLSDLEVRAIQDGGPGEADTLSLLWDDGASAGELRIVNGGQFIDSYQFADGVIVGSITPDRIGSSDLLIGTRDDSLIIGTQDRDFIFGNGGDDTLDAGDNANDSRDQLFGGIGDDTYVVRASNKSVFVAGETERSGSEDLILFQDLSLSDITVSEYNFASTAAQNVYGPALSISWTANGGGDLRVANMGAFIEEYLFADGSSLTSEEMLQLL